jgi:hypothetical protein
MNTGSPCTAAQTVLTIDCMAALFPQRALPDLTQARPGHAWVKNVPPQR